MIDFNDFELAFREQLSGSHRWAAFLWIAQHLLTKQKPLVILETGTVRTPGNWHGDGNSTLLWDYLCAGTGGEGFSIDLDNDACARARKLVTTLEIVQGDSIRMLGLFLPQYIARVDLLYLDSFDWSHERGAESALHHAGELAAVWSRLPSGCLIAVDDCFDRDVGKHMMVSDFFRRMKIDPSVTGYVHVWKKP